MTLVEILQRDQWEASEVDESLVCLSIQLILLV